LQRSRAQRARLTALQRRRRAVRQIRRCDRADLAVGLRDQHVGRQRHQRRLVDLIQRLAGAQPLAHALIDGRAGTGDVERRRADRRQPLHPGRMIALVRSPDQPIAQPQRHHQLGPAGQQRDDTLRGRRHRPAVVTLAKAVA
jgi:hypothetical protein